MDPSRLRNLGIAAHIDAGKTTVTERMLVLSGVERRFGRVDEGSATMDWLQEERERGITISAASTRLPWRGHVLNLIDTPGHVDFTLEVERSMRVLDGAVLVLDGAAGVQAQTEVVWRQMARHGVAALAFVNKCDRPEVELEAVLESLRERLGVAPLLVHHLWQAEGHAPLVLDLVSETVLGGGEAPEAAREEAQVLRAELVEQLAAQDEELLEAFASLEHVPADALSAAIRRAVLQGTGLPVLVGSALSGLGVEALLEAITAWLPAPGERAALGLGGAEFRPSAGTALLVFKSQRLGGERLEFARVVSGRLRPGDVLLNPRTGAQGAVAALHHLHADSMSATDEAPAGDIVGLVGGPGAGTGDTLCASEGMEVLAPPVIPEPVLGQRLEPEQDQDRAAIRAALAELVLDDPSLRVREDAGAGHWMLEGMGELHLEIARQRLLKASGAGLRVGRPEVHLVETLQGAGLGRSRIRREDEGGVRFGEVEVAVRPFPAGGGLELGPAESLPEPLRMAIQGALEAGRQAGPRVGAPLEGLVISVRSVESRPGEDAEAAFAQAALLALREAVLAGGLAVEEPLMAYEVVAPEEFASTVAGDLASRGAQVEGVRSEGRSRVLWGTVALERMSGYATGLRSVTQGRGTYTLRPAGRTEVGESELRRRGLLLD